MTQPPESSFSNATYGGCGCLLLLMCISVLGSIALPSFPDRAGKAMQFEAKQYVSSINKGQQAYFAEKSAFATAVNGLELGIKTETTNYKYSVQTTKKAAFSYGVSKEKNLKSYVGAVFVIQVKSNNTKDEMRTESILCSADKHGAIRPLPPTLQKDKLVCGTGTTQVTN